MRRINLVQLRVPKSTTGRAPLQLVDQQARRIRYLRVSLTDRCNYRCTYCMPPQGVDYGPRHEVLSLEEIVDVVGAFARAGVRRVRLTGGEPTLRGGVVGLVARLGALTTDHGRPLEVVMTTNGERLSEFVEPLRDAGLLGLTVSLDSLDGARFKTITRRGNLNAVLGGIEAARRVGFAAVKINTVAVRGFNDDELGEITRYAWSMAMIPRFIEVMPMSGGDLFMPGEFMAAGEVRDTIARDIGGHLVADAAADVRGAGPATYWRVQGGRFDGHRLGTIAAMTENFCSTCNRLRLSTTGQLHGCLARDDTGDVRAALRSSDPGALAEVVSTVLGTKRDAHGFKLDGTGGPTKAMISIGG